jgi:FtsP/CotA-like multicopper oxidase with cupredoxin domain
VASVFIVEFNGKESSTDYYEAWSVFSTKEGAEKGKAFYQNKFRKGTVRIRELTVETGEEDKYNRTYTKE